jgi:hypothetical protein
VAATGAGGLFAVLTGDLLERVPADRVAAASGVTAAAQSLLTVVVNPMIGAAVDATGSFRLPCSAIAVAVAPALVIWSVWQPSAARDLAHEPSGHAKRQGAGAQS